jgi:hypothetical protein
MQGTLAINITFIAFEVYESKSYKVARHGDPVETDS